MQHKGRPLRRRSPKLQPKPRALIVCEGKVTEPSYLRGLRIEEQVQSVEIIIDDEGGTPKTLVERAAARMKQARRAAKAARDQNLLYEEIWCVFDIDEHPKIDDAVQQAKAHSISTAISNPCFELWLLLHFKDQRAAIHRHDTQCACRSFIKGFEKHVDFAELRDYVDQAIARATALEKWQDDRGCSGENPSTTVHRLAQRVKDLGKKAKLNEIQRAQIGAKKHRQKTRDSWPAR